MTILLDLLEDCLQASHNLVVSDGDKTIYIVMVKEIKVGTNFVVVNPNFLVVRTINDYYIIRNKKLYILDEYSKFGSISYEEIVREVEDTDIEMAFKQSYSQVKMY